MKLKNLILLISGKNMEEKSKIDYINFLNKQGKPDDFEESFGISCPDDKYGKYLYEHNYHKFIFDYKRWLVESLDKKQPDVKEDMGSVIDPVVSEIIVDMAEKIEPIKEIPKVKKKKKKKRGRPKGSGTKRVHKKKEIPALNQIIPTGKIVKEIEGYTIEKDIPAPTEARYGLWSSIANAMKINDSTVVNTKTEASRLAGAFNDRNFGSVRRKIKDNKYRVWKLKKKQQQRQQHKRSGE